MSPILKDTEKVLFCADNDGLDSASEKKLVNAAKHLAMQGVSVWQAMPEKEKQDFNDVLKTQGVDAIRQQLDKPILLQSAQTIESGKKQIRDILSSSQSQETFIDSIDLVQSTEQLIALYVKKSNSFTNAVQQKIFHLGDDDNLAKEYADQATLLSKEIEEICQKIIQDPELNAEIESFGNQYNSSELSSRGGFEAIEERLNAHGYLSKEDRPAILMRVRIDAQSAVRSQRLQQTQSRDGRKY